MRLAPPQTIKTYPKLKKKQPLKNIKQQNLNKQPHNITAETKSEEYWKGGRHVVVRRVSQIICRKLEA